MGARHAQHAAVGAVVPEEISVGAAWPGDETIIAPDTDTIIELVQAHIADVHNSFELEDMIEAVLVDVPDAD